MSRVTLERETTELLSLNITNNGVKWVDPVETAISLYPARPTTWVSSVPADGYPCVLVSGLAPGRYTIWARINSNPETPVLRAGELNVI